MVQVQNQRETNTKWYKRSGKNVQSFDFENYIIKVDGGGNLTRVNKRFPTLANKEEFYTLGGELKKGNGGHKRKGGDRQVEDVPKGGDRRSRRYNWYMDL